LPEVELGQPVPVAAMKMRLRFRHDVNLLTERIVVTRNRALAEEELERRY
jgi:hypothetical protein